MTTYTFNNLIHACIAGGSVEDINQILDELGDFLDINQSIDQNRHPRYEGKNLLQLCCSYGSSNAVKALLEYPYTEKNRTPINTLKMHCGFTPLALASDRGRLETVRVFLEHHLKHHLPFLSETEGELKKLWRTYHAVYKADYEVDYWDEAGIQAKIISLLYVCIAKQVTLSISKEGAVERVQNAMRADAELESRKNPLYTVAVACMYNIISSARFIAKTFNEFRVLANTRNAELLNEVLLLNDGHLQLISDYRNTRPYANENTKKQYAKIKRFLDIMAQLPYEMQCKICNAYGGGSVQPHILIEFFEKVYQERVQAFPVCQANKAKQFSDNGADGRYTVQPISVDEIKEFTRALALAVKNTDRSLWQQLVNPIIEVEMQDAGTLSFSTEVGNDTFLPPKAKTPLPPVPKSKIQYGD
jgi:hypothetical protein